MTARRIAFAGLGAMGSGMVRRLLERGHEVIVWNRTPARAAALTAAGARAVTTPAELGAEDPDLTFVSLADDGAVAEVVLGEAGLARSLPDGAVLCNLSTVAPEGSRQLAQQLAQHGVTLMETTVLGNHEHAATGQLRIYVSGPTAGLESARPVLEDLGKEVLELGEYGAATSLKICLNLLMGVQMQALAEAVAVGERSGLPSQVLLDAIAASGYCSPVMRFKTRAVAAERWERADFRLDLMRKDLTLAEALAGAAQLPVPAVEASRAVLDAAIRAGRGALDCSAVVQQMREQPARPDPQRLAG